MAEKFIRRIIVEIPEIITIEGLKITASVTLSLTGLVPQCQISIFNMSDDSRSRIIENSNLNLRIGYGQDAEVPVVYSGRITNFQTEKQGPDIITTIFCGVRMNQIFKSSYAQGSRLETVLSDVVLVMGKRVGTFNPDTIKSITTTSGWTHSGTCKGILDALAREFQFSYQIKQNQEVDFIGDNAVFQVKEGEEAVVVSPETGLLSTPFVNEIGVSLATMFEGKIVPGSLIKVEATRSILAIQNIKVASQKRSPDGFYRVLQVQHSCDNRDGDFVTIVERARRLIL